MDFNEDGWQWHQLDNMQIIYTSLHTSQFFTGQMLLLTPNCVKALKAVDYKVE